MESQINLFRLVATQRDSSTRKSAIPSGTWSPQASTPEPGHVTKFLRDKNNNDVMKLLMNASPERSPSPVRLCKLGPDRQPNGCQATQACPTEKRPTTGQRSADGSGSTNTSQASKGGVSARLAQEGVHKSSMKSGVFLRTVHTLYKCKKAEDALAEKQTADMERNCSPTNHQQGTAGRGPPRGEGRGGNFPQDLNQFWWKIKHIALSRGGGSSHLSTCPWPPCSSWRACVGILVLLCIDVYCRGIGECTELGVDRCFTEARQT